MLDTKALKVNHSAGQRDPAPYTKAESKAQKVSQKYFSVHRIPTPRRRKHSLVTTECTQRRRPQPAKSPI